MYTYFDTLLAIAEFSKCGIAKLDAQALGNSVTQLWMRRSAYKLAIAL
jgi:hypothetical protein